MSQALATPQSASVRGRTQAQRRQATNKALMEATIDLLIERGYGALTVAQVAARAGVSRGALTHHYATKDELMLAAATFAMDREMGHVEEFTDGVASLDRVLSAFLDVSQAFFLSTWFSAQLEFLFAARSNPQIAGTYLPLIEKYRQRFDSAWRAALMTAGLEHGAATDLIELINHTIRGLSLGIAGGASPESVAQRFGRFKEQLVCIYYPTFQYQRGRE